MHGLVKRAFLENYALLYSCILAVPKGLTSLMTEKDRS